MQSFGILWLASLSSFFVCASQLLGPVWEYELARDRGAMVSEVRAPSRNAVATGWGSRSRPRDRQTPVTRDRKPPIYLSRVKPLLRSLFRIDPSHETLCVPEEKAKSRPESNSADGNKGVPDNIARSWQRWRSWMNWPVAGHPATIVGWPQRPSAAMVVRRTEEGATVSYPNPQQYVPLLASGSIRPEVSEDEGATYQIWVKGRAIAEVSDGRYAEEVAGRVEDFLQDPTLAPHQIRPVARDGQLAVEAGDRVLFPVRWDLASQPKPNAHLQAIEWANQLRSALATPPLSLTEAQIRMHELTPTERTLSGLASWYGPYFHGRLTANGEKYDQYAFTVAHKSLPFDTYLKVTNLENNKSVIVRVNDRGPYIEPRILDLSLQAARCLGSEDDGVVQVEATIVEPQPQPSIASDSVTDL